MSSTAASPKRQHRHQHLVIPQLGDDQALTWFVRLNRPDVNGPQLMAFNRWLGLDPANRRSYAEVVSLWQKLGPRTPLSKPTR